jgi:hypothetical protein
VDVESDAPAHAASFHCCGGGRAGGPNDRDGSALAAHPGESQGRPSTNSDSRSIEHERPARPAFAPGCPRPGRSHRTSRPGRLGRASGRGSRAASAPFHTGYKPARARQPRDRPAHRRRGHLPRRRRARPTRTAWRRWSTGSAPTFTAASR